MGVKQEVPTLFSLRHQEIRSSKSFSAVHTVVSDDAVGCWWGRDGRSQPLAVTDFFSVICHSVHSTSSPLERGREGEYTTIFFFFYFISLTVLRRKGKNGEEKGVL